MLSEKSSVTGGLSCFEMFNFRRSFADDRSGTKELYFQPEEFQFYPWALTRNRFDINVPMFLVTGKPPSVKFKPGAKLFNTDHYNPGHFTTTMCPMSKVSLILWDVKLAYKL